MSDLERELESELRRVLDPLAATPIPPRRALATRTAARTVLGGAGAALGLKLITGVAVAAAAVTVAGAATTGSLNPQTWGQVVSQHVADCKAKLGDGQHGIGDCVSVFASQHGQAVASDARHHGTGSGSGNTNAGANSHGNNPNANDHAKDKTRKGDTSEPTDPSSHPPVTVPSPHP